MQELATSLLLAEEWEAHQARRLAPRQRSPDDADHRRGAICGGESSGAGAAARSEVDRDVACRAVKKKRHADDGHADVHVNGDKKKPRRRAPNGGEGSSAAAAEPIPGDDNLVRQFRELWVFNTHYSTLVDTMARAEELLLGATAAGGFPASVEELFPRRESREFLKSYYAGHWGIMRAALERGETTRPALEAVLESLTRKEEEAVAEAVRQRRQQDAARVAEGLGGLVIDRVHREVRRRQDAGGGGASGQHASARVPGGGSNRGMNRTRHDAQESLL